MNAIPRLLPVLALVWWGHRPMILTGAEPPRRFDLAKRASEIDARAAEHPEIDFVFTDDQGKPRDLQHASVDPRVSSRGGLVIWLMDHNAGLAERVAGYGLHYIQVSYANRWFSKLTKEQLNQGDTIGRIRLEAATGEDHSPVVTIPKPDSIEVRAFQFVRWLARENPEGKWGQFIDGSGETLVWDRVILAGISHGSTTAARLAIHRRVGRVVMFSGPRDNTETWQGLPSATPSNRYFGFTHVLDGGWTADHYCRSWQLLRLQRHGPVVNVDREGPPFGNSRRLVTDADVGNHSGRAHSAPVPGGAAVKDAAGGFLHEEVWRYLFTHPVDRTGASVPMDPDCEMNPVP